MSTQEKHDRLLTVDEMVDLIKEQMEIDLFQKDNPPIKGAQVATLGGTRPAFPDPNTMTNRWVKGVQDKAQNWVDGIQNPRADFKQAALANNAGWKAAVTKAVNEDAFAKAMNQVDVAMAIQTALKVGASGYTAGALARAPKFTAAMTKWAPAAAAAVQTVRNLAKVTDTDRENRAVGMIRGFKAAKKALKGR